MNTLIKYLLIPVLCAVSAAGSRAQESVRGMTPEVYYLMPEFQEGTVYFRGKAPAQGKLNICAVDNTLRFLDNDGTELSASQSDNIFKVKIDTVVFMLCQNVFYRLYPVSMDMGVARRRDVHIIKDAKQTAFGGVSQTQAIREYGTIYADGVAYNLNTAKEYPYRMSETLYIYYGDEVYPVNKKSLRKLFPDKKAEIDSFFKSGASVPESVEGLQALLSSWM